MTDMDSDRISCLPDHIIDCILSRLSIKEAGRTSVLSNKWRKKWSTQPDLVFDRQCVSATVSQDPSVIENKFVRTIDHVLLLHSGPINKFKISDSGCDLISMKSVADIDRWILHLTKRSIKNLMLDIFLKQDYKIPWCLFSCQSLRHLNLYCCLLKPPTMFEGFKNLKSLELEQVMVAQDAFENLISGSPLLEKLVLKKVDGFTQINIHAPSIKFVDIRGNFEGISFDNTSQLTKVFVDLSSYLNSETGQSMLHGCSSNLLKVLKCQGMDLILLTLQYRYLCPSLCILSFPPWICNNCMQSWTEAHTSPLTPASATYCWENIFSAPAMPIQVRHVAIDGIFGTNLELDFMKFLLLYSPVLEKMTVKPVESFILELVRGLIRFIVSDLTI